MSPFKVFIAVFLSLLAIACARPYGGKHEAARQLPASWKITVAPFTQPYNPSQLVTGSIPAVQGHVNEKDLEGLDRTLRQVLQSETRRSYAFLPQNDLPADWKGGKSTGQPTALSRWLGYGKEHGAEFLLVPQILDWHEREGSEAGVTRSAHARLEFFLLDIPRGTLVNRSVFEEKQVGLIDNLFDVGKFVRRKGQWVTAQDLAIDGMRKAVRELGL